MPNNSYPTSVPQDLRANNEDGVRKFDGIDHEDQEKGFMDFIPKLQGDSDRKGFVTKVFGILAAQMVITTLFVYFMISSDDRIQFVQNSPWIYVICSVVAVIVEIPLVCCKSVARVVPINYILLGVFTI